MNKVDKPNIVSTLIMIIGINLFLATLFYMFDSFGGNLYAIVLLPFIDLYVSSIILYAYFKQLNKYKNSIFEIERKQGQLIIRNENLWLESILKNNLAISNFQNKKETINNLFKNKLEQNKSALQVEFIPFYENLASYIDKLIALVDSQYESLNYIKTKINVIEKCEESYGKPLEFDVITKFNISKVIKTIDTVSFINNYAVELLQNHIEGYFPKYYYLFNDYDKVGLFSTIEETELNSIYNMETESLNFIKKTYEILNNKGILDLKSYQFKRDKFKNINKDHDFISNISLSRTDIDPLLEECAYLIFETDAGSVSMLVRRFNLGYNRAGRIIDQLEQLGILGPSNNGKHRDVMVLTKAEIEEIFSSIKD